MEINQKNIFGDNVVNIATPDREVTEEFGDKILTGLQSMGVDSVAIHYESDGETTDFVNKIAAFLDGQYVIARTSHTQSGIPRHTILLEPSSDPDSTWAYLRVGTQ